MLTGQSVIRRQTHHPEVLWVFRRGLGLSDSPQTFRAVPPPCSRVARVGGWFFIVTTGKRPRPQIRPYSRQQSFSRLDLCSEICASIALTKPSR